MMTNERLAEIDARWKVSSTGEWRVGIYNDQEADGCVEVTGEGLICDVFGVGGSSGDLDFIAAAHQDIPDLIAEVRRLTAERDAVQAKMDHLNSNLLDWYRMMSAPIVHERAVALAQVEKLTAERDDAQSVWPEWAAKILDMVVERTGAVIPAEEDIYLPEMIEEDWGESDAREDGLRKERDEARAQVAALREALEGLVWREVDIGPTTSPRYVCRLCGQEEHDVNCILDRTSAAAAEHDRAVRKRALEEALKVCDWPNLEPPQAIDIMDAIHDLINQEPTP